MIQSNRETYENVHPEPMWSKSLDLVLFINLEKRTDRRAQFLLQAQSLGIPCEKVVRINALISGFRGCTLSHRNAIHFAILQNCKQIMICEDDFTVLDLSIFHASLNTAVSHKWNVLMAVMSPIRLVTIDKYICKVRQALGMCGYIVRNSYFVKLLQIFEESLTKNQPHDMITQQYQDRDQWYGLQIPVAHQANGWSDIENRMTDYKYLEIDRSMLQ